MRCRQRIRTGERNGVPGPGGSSSMRSTTVRNTRISTESESILGPSLQTRTHERRPARAEERQGNSLGNRLGYVYLVPYLFFGGGMQKPVCAQPARQPRRPTGERLVGLRQSDAM